MLSKFAQTQKRYKEKNPPAAGLRRQVETKRRRQFPKSNLLFCLKTGAIDDGIALLPDYGFDGADGRPEGRR